MREFLFSAARHFRRGETLADRGDLRGAAVAYHEALSDLHAVKPQRMRDVLLAQVYLSRSRIEADLDPARAERDFRLGYSYARTTQEPRVRDLAERMRHDRLASRTAPSPR
ncbi:MAG: hypothetical protein WD336_09735 [Trueperaceae bacterium]